MVQNRSVSGSHLNDVARQKESLEVSLLEVSLLEVSLREVSLFVFPLFLPDARARRSLYLFDLRA